MKKRVLAMLLTTVMILAIVWAAKVPAHTGTIASGNVGEGGAAWRMHSDGRLVVQAGTIYWNGPANGWESPWHSLYADITRIEFTGEITAGESLSGLFLRLKNVIEIEGLHYFNTSNVTDMSYMFDDASSLESLDLSSWDTSRVTNMISMFERTRSLVNLNTSGWDTGNVERMDHMFASATSLWSLDLSGWDTSSVRNMSRMFENVGGLRAITLGGSFRVSRAMGVRALGLSDPPVNQIYCGKWRNVGSGTLTAPQGEHIFTTAQLVDFYRLTDQDYDNSAAHRAHAPSAARTADTWVWNRIVVCTGDFRACEVPGCLECIVVCTGDSRTCKVPGCLECFVAPELCPRCGKEQECFLLGNVSGSGEVGIADALQILRFLVNLPSSIEPGNESWCAALIVSDESPGIADALQILRYLVHLPNKITGSKEPLVNLLQSNIIACAEVETGNHSLMNSSGMVVHASDPDGTARPDYDCGEFPCGAIV